MKVALSAGAWDDLGEIATWIARDNPDRAISYIDELLDACTALSAYPRIYPRWPGKREREIRRCNHNDHAIFYEVRADAVLVLGIVHGSRDMASLIEAR